MQKRENFISKEDFIKLSNELDELKVFKDAPPNKIEDIKANLNKFSGGYLSEKMQNLKELKPDLFVEKNHKFHQIILLKIWFKNKLKIKMMKLKLLKKKEHVLLRKLKN